MINFPYFVAIAGGTASGKSTLSHMLKELASDEHLDLILLDSYYRCQKDKAADDRVKTNYDHPDAFEFDLLVEHLRDLKFGRAVELPVYDFTVHTRSMERASFAPRPVIVIEGILVLHDARVRDLCALKLFVDAPSDLRKDRRVKRDVRERGRTAECVDRQWHESVHPMHETYCEPTRRFADRIIDGRRIDDQMARALLAELPLP